ncbi:mTERF domain-containing protein 1-like protein [Dinothrombium tinctorium]|uniref:mTERF domain-containing protein 1-like protein n=1 Tax=Dinothrombium tinctorium TaxID=1965070 RepID=A0A3S3PZ30_9ACAR|nr:mTERF domain-containing protein 1-like protein [Dinothrombium tinctorium]
MCTVRALNSISRALCRNHGLLTNASLLAAFNRHSSFGYCSKSDLQSKQELIYDLKKYPHLSENETHQLFDAFNRSLNEKLKLNSLSEECNPQTLDSLSAPLPITFNLAAYVDRSNTLKRLVDLGVDLYKVERSKEACEHILRLDFNKDIKPYISFLHDKGIPADKLGHFISEFPLVFSESTYNLQLRLDYLRSKHFTRNAIIKILTKHPRFLSKPIVDVDSSLGFVQNHFGFTGDEIRKITEKWPLIVEVPHQQLRVCHFSFKEEMGFEPKLMRKVMIKIPSVTVEGKNLSFFLD